MNLIALYIILVLSILIQIAYNMQLITNALYIPLVFLFCCMPLRGFIAYAGSIMGNNLIPMATGAVSLGFLSTYYRENNKEIKNKGAFGGDPYWHDERLLHGFIYAAFTILYLYGVEQAWILLALDVLIGFGTFVQNKYI